MSGLHRTMFIVVIALLLGALKVEAGPKSGLPKVGDQAPKVRVLSWLNTNKVPYDWRKRTKGKVVLLDFGATWCKPCLQSMPHIQQLYKRHHNQGLEVVGVTNEEFTSEVIKKFGDRGVTYPIGQVSSPWDIGYTNEGWPEIFVIDRNGRVVWKSGSKVRKPAEIDQAVLKALKQK